MNIFAYFMPALRSIVFLLGSILVLICVAITSLIFFFMPIKFRYAIISQWAKFNIWWLGVVVGLHYQIIGKENIPKQPCVILSNHQSTWETFVFQVVFPQQVWVLKQSLLYIPIFGWGLALTAPIVINRAKKIQALKSIITQGINRLNRGLWVVIFPEGTRQGSGIKHYQNGGAMMAQKAGVSILPVYHNAANYWKKGQFVKRAGVIKLVIGKLIIPQEQHIKTVKELSKQVENWAKEQEAKYGD